MFKLKKLGFAAIAALGVAIQVASVAAQTTSPTPTPESPLMGNILGAVVVIVLGFIAFAGYKIIKKWSRPGPD